MTEHQAAEMRALRKVIRQMSTAVEVFAKWHSHVSEALRADEASGERVPEKLRKAILSLDEMIGKAEW